MPEEVLNPKPEKSAIKENVVKSKRRRNKKLKKNTADFVDDWQYSDSNFYFIAGYTLGGAPYGLIWEEMGIDPEEN